MKNDTALSENADVLWIASGVDELMRNEDQPLRGQPYALEVPGPAMREASSIADLGLWLSIGEAWAHLAAQFAAPGSAPRVLDIGCGCGKMARFFLMNPRATYIGLDIYGPAIEWCAQHFTRWSRFKFQQLDVHSALYNPSGETMPEDVTLPVKTRSIDMVIAGSLFTHLLEPGFRNYMAEIARVLVKPLYPTSPRRGRALVSIHDEPADGRFSGDESRIDISQALFAEIVEANGLRIAKHIGNVFSQQVFALETRWRSGR